MKDMTTLRHIAGLYLDIYSSPRDLERPLTPEQVKDAGVLFIDLLAAHEAEALIALERQKQETVKCPSYHDIAQMFVERYKSEEGIAGPLTEDDWYKASDVFLDYISEY